MKQYVYPFIIYDLYETLISYRETAIYALKEKETKVHFSL